MITAQQIRGARAMLGLSQSELARRAGTSAAALDQIESGIAGPETSIVRAVKGALERAGIAFIEDDGSGPGVRLKRAAGGRTALRPDELNASNDE